MNFTKIKWILGISLVFLLILATNLIDRKSYHQMKDTVENIYEDRLVTKNILFEITLLTEEKVLAIALEDSTFFNSRNNEVNSKINEYSHALQDKNLTPNEEHTLEVFNKNLSELIQLENKYVQQADPVKRKETESSMLNRLKKIEKNFQTLAEIQLEEGKRQMYIGRQAVESIELLNKMEFYLLLVLAIVVQVIILYKKKSDKLED